MHKQIEKKEKNWILKSIDSQEYREKVENIALALGINPVVAKLLYNRGYTDEQSAKAFVYMESEMLRDPFLMKDVDKAIVALKSALDDGKKLPFTEIMM